jgi:hypothetical protein
LDTLRSDRALRPDGQRDGRLLHLAVVFLDLAKPADRGVERFADLVEFKVQLVAWLRHIWLQRGVV